MYLNLTHFILRFIRLRCRADEENGSLGIWLVKECNYFV